MNFSRLPVRLISAAVLSCLAGASHAAFTFGTSSGANTATNFSNSLPTGTKGIDTFDDLTINADMGTSSLPRSAGPIGYTVSTETNLYTTQANGIGGSALTVEFNTDTLTFGGFTAPMAAPILYFGARFFYSDLSYGVNSGVMTVRATDTDGLTQDFVYTQTVSASTSGSTEPLFFRLGSTVALQSVQLIGSTPGSLDAGANPLLFATVDNVTVGAVPLPAAGWLLISGLGAMGFMKRRRS